MSPQWAHEWSLPSPSACCDGDELPVCFDITCGQRGVHFAGAVLREFAGVSSACHCKQLCLEHTTIGHGVCRSWKFFNEVGVDLSRVTSCVLLRGADYILSEGDDHWVSGDIGVILQSVSPALVHLEVVDIVVHGVGLPRVAEAPRLKIVLESETCGAPGTDSVLGLTCSNGFACSPSATAAFESNTTFSNVEIINAPQETTYKACYCAGPCHSAWQYTPVPGVIRVPAANFSHTLDMTTDPYRLTLSGPLETTRTNFAAAWRLKYVKGFQCTLPEAPRMSITGNPASFTDEVELQVDPAGLTSADIGRYTLCICSQEIDQSNSCPNYERVAESAPVRVVRTEADSQLTADTLVTSQRLSMQAGVATDVKLVGHQLQSATWGNAQVRLVSFLDCGANIVVTATASVDEGMLVARVEVPGDTTPKQYTVCAKTTTGAFSIVGDMWLTRRVRLGQTWVFHPDRESSLEVTGTELDSLTDRVLVVDCSDTCGLAGPSMAVNTPGKDTRLPAMQSFRSYSPLPSVGTYEEDTVERGVYTTIADRYCHAAPLAAPEAYSCASKCREPCIAEECFCAGYLSDTVDSTALCLSPTACMRVCSETEGCYGMSMHSTLPRCFLHSEECGQQVDSGTLGINVEYDFLIRKQALRRLDIDRGGSSPTMLRFAPLAITGGGRFKVCFCDKEQFPSSQLVCETEGDFAIEVGEIFVSGVSCLLAQPKLRRVSCVEQYHGGLRCGEGLGSDVSRGIATRIVDTPSAFGVSENLMV